MSKDIKDYSEKEFNEYVQGLIDSWNISSEDDKERMRKDEQHEIDVAMKKAIRKRKM